ncbi:cupin domain-containing protein [Massilia atriviolacea]|uniref:Cupin domain-containing protein n=1 Tax=Massilia atriviolacea TaxID=2495579 RepID=A0A430HN02_9BURK|nr:cupin domain-containing protein [Massilia atriviolacea]RSZ58883.1 cupin domain-containing protein [Massilia atriviolacea]
MINISTDLDINDRWPLSVFPVAPGQQRQFKAEGTDYILLRNADFQSSEAHFRGVNGAFAISAETDYAITCPGGASAFVIRYKGLRLSEQRYYIQNKLDMGNLSYMDGGTNTTAVNPGRLGDPVVNYVHFPAHMYQTLHTHPSHRIGLILSGNGRIELDNQEFFNVEEGSAFFMRRNELHNFITTDQAVVLFVFAPDSGTGPTDEVNPLKIRTYIGQQRHVR